MSDKAITVGQKVKARTLLQNDMRDEGFGLIHCANKGDTLIVERVNSRSITVHAESSPDYRFNVSIHEIEVD